MCLIFFLSRKKQVDIRQTSLQKIQKKLWLDMKIGVHSSFGLKIVLNIRCTELNGTVKHFLCIEFENIP